jgi:hypothetical protein
MTAKSSDIRLQRRMKDKTSPNASKAETICQNNTGWRS